MIRNNSTVYVYIAFLYTHRVISFDFDEDIVKKVASFYIYISYTTGLSNRYIYTLPPSRHTREDYLTERNIFVCVKRLFNCVLDILTCGYNTRQFLCLIVKKNKIFTYSYSPRLSMLLIIFHGQ